MTENEQFEPQDMQTTLYDVGGLDPSASDADVLEQIARLSTDNPDAYRVRKGLALEALADTSFRASYDEHLAMGGGWRENNHLPNLPQMPAADWGSAEMSAWIKSTKAILAPVRRDRTKFEMFPDRARKVFQRDLPGAVWISYGSFATLISAALGGGPLHGLLGLETLGVPVVAAIGGLMGSILSSIYQAARGWKTRFALVTSSLATIPVLSVSPLLAAVFAATTIFAVLFTAGMAERAEAAWASEAILPPTPHSPWVPVDGQSQTRLGSGTASPALAAGVLRAWAGRLGFPLTDASADDLVSAVITADAWAFALGADSISQGANYGPASLGAISAAIARASGHGESTLPMMQGEWASPNRMPGLREALLDWKSWASLQLGPERAAYALETAAADLAWGGGGDDRLTRLARVIAGTAR